MENINFNSSLGLKK